MQEMTLSEVQQVSGGWIQVAFAIGVVGGAALAVPPAIPSARCCNPGGRSTQVRRPAAMTFTEGEQRCRA